MLPLGQIVPASLMAGLLVLLVLSIPGPPRNVAEPFHASCAGAANGNPSLGTDCVTACEKHPDLQGDSNEDKRQMCSVMQRTALCKEAKKVPRVFQTGNGPLCDPLKLAQSLERCPKKVCGRHDDEDTCNADVKCIWSDEACRRRGLTCGEHLKRNDCDLDDACTWNNSVCESKWKAPCAKPSLKTTLADITAPAPTSTLDLPAVPNG